MNERIHRHLDGELPLEELSPDERREVARYEEAIRRTAASAAAEPVPDVTAAVMARIDRQAHREARESQALTSSPSGAARRLAAWLWSPRPIRVRPAYALAAAALLAALIPVLPERDASVPAATVAGAPATERAPAEAQVFVQFRLDAPEASSVHLAGSFTEWEPEYALHQTAPGVWSLLVPLDAGVHEYAFVVDGAEWRADPTGPRVSDGFGGENNRVTVLPPNGRTL